MRQEENYRINEKQRRRIKDPSLGFEKGFSREIKESDNDPGCENKGR